ncbi:xylulokinase [Paramicrobacterium humi]|uniref:Xylulokinase n=1 Tax=Paramicrobacterium humi TaxID=640635 RepID=A0A1H4KIY8_9MICO|nr:FGGY family carbohydrate kinase [Microbacterium humi]SEB58514.1 xylulokinase [Microbacterium humi]
MARTASEGASPATAAPDDAALPDAAVAVGIDIGSTNTKAVLVSCGGPRSELRELAVRQFSTPDTADELRDSVTQALRELTAVAPRHPLVVGIASMAETGVPLDAAGTPLTPLVRWNASADATVFERIDPERFFCATGVPALPKVPLAMWHALGADDPGLWRRLARWSGVADLIAHTLAGHCATDHTLAGRTGAYLLPARGERMPRGFDARLLALVGLTPDKLPDVVAPGEAVGAVSAAAAHSTGLREGTPVYVAGHDHAVGAWGAGARGPGDDADSMGTTEALVRVLGAPADRAAVSATGMSLTRTVPGAHESLLAGASGGSLLAGWAHSPGPVDGTTRLGELIRLPYPSGRQTPHPDRTARDELIDIAGRPVDPATRSDDELRRATLLGLCLQLRWMAETQQNAAADPLAPSVEPLAVIGGAPAGNAEWLALKSAVLGRPLRVAHVAQPVACSAALLAAVRAGVCADDVRLPAASVITPPAESEAQAAYDTFRRAALAAPTPTEERRV